MNIKEYVAIRKEELKNEISSYNRTPQFVIIQVNDDPASNAYVKGKLKDAAEVGINCELRKFDIDISEEKLLEEIEKVNQDNNVDGLIVQLPLPKHISEDKIKLAVAPEKDVDGFHPLSTLDPCTPKGIINYLKYLKTDFVGKNAVVIGRSNIVGKPMARLLLKESCNVTVLHSKTNRTDMEMYIANADIIVVAVGRAEFLNNSFTFKNDAIVVDVGINRVDGHLVGDAQPGLPVALQTPVPGGVGLITRLTLLDNLMEIYRNGI